MSLGQVTATKSPNLTQTKASVKSFSFLRHFNVQDLLSNMFYNIDTQYHACLSVSVMLWSQAAHIDIRNVRYKSVSLCVISYFAGLFKREFSL